MKRAIIITKGRVPRVGYRDLVADWAMDLGIVGFIENQPDGTVKIVAEGEEEILEDFVRKAQPEDDPLIRIARVDVGYEKAEKQDVMIEKQDQMLGKQDQMLTKQVETIAVIKTYISQYIKMYSIKTGKQALLRLHLYPLFLSMIDITPFLAIS